MIWGPIPNPLSSRGPTIRPEILRKSPTPCQNESVGTYRFTVDLADDLADRLKAHSSDTGVSISEIGRRAIARVVAEPSPYRFGADGDRACLVKDVAAAKGLFVDGVSGDEAVRRLRRFEQWSADVAAPRFDVTQTSGASVIPPGYRVMGDLQWTAERPLVAAASAGGTITDATPFKVPVLEGLTDAGAAGFDVIDTARAEGAQPTEGTAAPKQRTVTPVVRTGRLDVTRELVDAAVPAGDAIALAAAVEDYRREAEALAYANLNAAQSGTITAGFVPNGAQARTSTSTALPADLRLALAEYATRRLGRARNVVVGGTTAPTQLVGALNDATGDDDAVARIQGARVNWATNAFGGAAGDADVLILGTDDFYVWESPLLRFSYGEKQGPAVVEIGTWGYVAAEVIRPRGLSSIRHT
jgi:hypothetical protein